MILVAGSANLDFVVRASTIPMRGETVLGHGFATYPGGKGANQAVASARAGDAATHFLCALGNDPYAVPLEASLQSAGVHSHVVRIIDCPTGCAFICVSDDAENAIAVAPGANLRLLPAHLPSLSGYTHLLMQLEIPLGTVRAFAAQAKEAGVQVVLNAAPAQALPQELLDLVDVLVVNEGELDALAGPQGTLSERMERLRVASVVVTLGAQGAMARIGGVLHTQTAFLVTPVDTTGAGDTFCGTLVGRLSQGAAFEEAFLFACAAAALACTRAGAQSSVPSAAEVQKFLANNP